MECAAGKYDAAFGHLLHICAALSWRVPPSDGLLGPSTSMRTPKIMPAYLTENIYKDLTTNDAHNIQ
jgi:hypothetical protein